MANSAEELHWAAHIEKSSTKKSAAQKVPQTTKHGIVENNRKRDSKCTMFISSRCKGGLFCLFSFLLIASSAVGQLVDEGPKNGSPQNSKINSIKVNNIVTSDSIEQPADTDRVLSKKYTSLNSKYVTQSPVTSDSSVGLFKGSKKSEYQLFRKLPSIRTNCSNHESALGWHGWNNWLPFNWCETVPCSPRGLAPVESENMARFLMTDYDCTQHETLTLKIVLIYYFFVLKAIIHKNRKRRRETSGSKGSVGLPCEQARPRIAWFIST